MNEASPQTGPPSRRLVAALLLVVGLGVLAFWLGVASHPAETWKVFLVNFMFWSGLAIAGVVFAAILELTNAQWAGPVRRVAESFAAFLPISFLLYLILLAGAGSLYPWIHHPPPARAAWFTYSSFVWRDTTALLVLYGLAFAFSVASRRKASTGDQRTPGVSTWAVLLVIVYAFAFSLVAIDLVMSLDPSWASTLFPAYFFMGNLYAGLAAITVGSAVWRRATGAEAWFDDSRAHDLGKLLFGFCLLWTYLFWSQFLVIWYGNLPDDVSFLMVRTQRGWQALSWVVLFLCFALPFVVLLSRAAKRPGPLAAVALTCLAGMWLERFLLIVPSETVVPTLSWADPAVTLGFLALFVLPQTVVAPSLDR